MVSNLTELWCNVWLKHCCD